MKATNYPHAENVCEHGDHPAPKGKRFCSPECAQCELLDADFSVGCAGLCLGRPRVDKDRGPK
jgi:hypothetical protein